MNRTTTLEPTQASGKNGESAMLGSPGNPLALRKSCILWIAAIAFLMLLGCGLIFALMSNLSGGPQEASVALIHIEGAILPGKGGNSNPLTGSGGAYSTTIVDQLKQAAEDELVKAVVLVVDSPGGSVYASDEIARQVAAMEKPVLSAMGSMAASGGYFVSAPADEIWASPHTLTCSIGVIIELLNYDKLAADYGVEAVVYKSGANKDMGNPFRQATPEEEQIWQAMIDEAYDAFVTVVASGRDLAEERVREIADGRVCTGQQALALKLVDKLGYLPDVIKRAGELGGIEGDPPTIEYQQQPGLWDLLTSAVTHRTLGEEIQQLIDSRAGATLMYLYR
ncbi:MAG: signal peptide peptidase SppA [Caldilineaceae bacterium]|nr:signal peptide peptidase SppA [Caldilineaceae bacterium]